MNHECFINASEIYPVKIKRPVLEDKGKYIALFQLVSKMHHEYIMNQS